MKFSIKVLELLGITGVEVLIVAFLHRHQRLLLLTAKLEVDSSLFLASYPQHEKDIPHIDTIQIGIDKQERYAVKLRPF